MSVKDTINKHFKLHTMNCTLGCMQFVRKLNAHENHKLNIKFKFEIKSNMSCSLFYRMLYF